MPQNTDQLKMFLARFLNALLPVLIVAIAAYLGIQHHQKSIQTFDVFDEGAHFDYVLKLSEGHVPSWGSTYSQETMHIADCLGNPLVPGPTNCAVQDRNPSNYAPAGFSYEAQQPPLGYIFFLPGVYVIAGDKQSALSELETVRDFGGTLNLALSCLLLSIIAWLRKFNFIQSTIVASIILLAPITIHAFSTVNNDGFSLVSSLFFLTLFAFCRTRRGISTALLGVLAGVFLGLTKGFLLLLPFALLTVLMISALQGNKWRFKGLKTRLDKRSLQFLIASVSTAGIIAAAFTFVQAKRAIVPAGDVLGSLLGFAPKVDFVQFDTVASSFANLLNPLLGASNGLINNAFIFAICNSVFLILLGISLVKQRTNAQTGNEPDTPPDTRLYGWSWLTGSLVFAVAWPTLLFLQGKFNFDAPTRYGLFLIPLAAIAVADGLLFKKSINKTFGRPRGTNSRSNKEAATNGH